MRLTKTSQSLMSFFIENKCINHSQPTKKTNHILRKLYSELKTANAFVQKKKREEGPSFYKLVITKPATKTTTSNPYTGTVNVTSTYVSKDTEGWFTLNSAEREQLYYIYKAITVNGSDPNYTSQDIAFAKLMDNIYANWPALHSPIQKLIVLKRKSIQNKYNKPDNFSKEVWKFPHQHENP